MSGGLYNVPGRMRGLSACWENGPSTALLSHHTHTELSMGARLELSLA